MREPIAVQHFEVVVNDRALGNVTQLPAGTWVAEVGSVRRLGPYRSPVDARDAVVDWHRYRAEQAAARRARSAACG